MRQQIQMFAPGMKLCSSETPSVSGKQQQRWRFGDVQQVTRLFLLRLKSVCLDPEQSFQLLNIYSDILPQCNVYTWAKLAPVRHFGLRVNHVYSDDTVLFAIDVAANQPDPPV